MQPKKPAQSEVPCRQITTGNASVVETEDMVTASSGLFLELGVRSPYGKTQTSFPIRIECLKITETSFSK